MDYDRCLESLKSHLENSESREGRIILSPEFFHSLLACLGIVAALLDSGKIYQAREFLGELGEVVYQHMKYSN